jgi:hypothetical protein
MAFWNLYYYVEPSGRCPFEEWLDDLPEDSKGHIEAKMDYMEIAATHSSKLIDKYQGRPGLFELKATFKNTPFRPLMCKHPRDGKGFVFLEGAIEVRWKIRTTHLDKADSRRKNLFEDPKRARPRHEQT